MQNHLCVCVYLNIFPQNSHILPKEGLSDIHYSLKSGYVNLDGSKLKQSQIQGTANPLRLKCELDFLCLATLMVYELYYEELVMMKKMTEFLSFDTPIISYSVLFISFIES